MAIAFDTSGSGTAGEASSSVTASAITTSGTERCAIMVVGWWSATYGAPTVTVGGSGTGVTQVGATFENGGESRLKIAVFRLVAPPTASSDYVATFGGGVDSSVIAVATYTGVDQATPITGSLGTNSDQSTAPTITISSATGELVVAAVYGGYPADQPTEDGGQTERVGLGNWSGTNYGFSLCDEAGAASVTESWTIVSAYWDTVAVRLAVASGATIVPQAMANYRMRAA